jgi:hypothetical protein
MDPGGGRTAFILAALIVVGWFALGTLFNIRRGNRLLRWLQHGLPLLGERTTVRWLGSSAVELKVVHALRPLVSAEVFLVLEPRDVPFLWWVFRVRGRRDLLILRGEVRAAPRFELEALRPRAWSTRGVARALERDRWTAVAVPSGSPLVAYGRRGEPADTSDILPIVTHPELALVRVAVHRTAPNLEIQWEVREAGRLDARDVVAALRRLAEQV